MVKTPCSFLITAVDHFLMLQCSIYQFVNPQIFSWKEKIIFFIILEPKYSVNEIPFPFCLVRGEGTSAYNRSVSFFPCTNYVSMSHLCCFVMPNVYTQSNF